VKFLTWTEDNLLRQVVYEGLRASCPSSHCEIAFNSQAISCAKTSNILAWTVRSCRIVGSGGPVCVVDTLACSRNLPETARSFPDKLAIV
jgi:hypothetical protein